MKAKLRTATDVPRAYVSPTQHTSVPRMLPVWRFSICGPLWIGLVDSIGFLVLSLTPLAPKILPPLK